MLAKRLEFRKVQPCTLPKPTVPEKIKMECESYIEHWNQIIYEENKNKLVSYIEQSKEHYNKIAEKYLKDVC